jgi:hypothetical protein
MIYPGPEKFPVNPPALSGPGGPFEKRAGEALMNVSWSERACPHEFVDMKPDDEQLRVCVEALLHPSPLCGDAPYGGAPGGGPY